MYLVLFIKHYIFPFGFYLKCEQLIIIYRFQLSPLTLISFSFNRVAVRKMYPHIPLFFFFFLFVLHILRICFKWHFSYTIYMSIVYFPVISFHFHLFFYCFFFSSDLFYGYTNNLQFYLWYLSLNYTRKYVCRSPKNPTPKRKFRITKREINSFII